MDKLKLHTPDLTAANVGKIAALFPNCVTEIKADDGTIRQAINFDQLRQELSTSIVEGPRERYHLDWPGKRASLALANESMQTTLRPARSESVDFESTRNLYIEGDNLDVLRLLQEAYLGQVKMIYIDPPYNTGNDFIYDDDFSMSRGDYQEISGEVDEEGRTLFDAEKWKQNSSSNGRFHSEWLSMIYPRLKLSRNLLTDDGLIFISISDKELANLTKVGNEVFGESNFLGYVARSTGQTTGQDGGGLGSSFDFILVFAKDASHDLSGLPLTSKDLKRFDGKDEKGVFAYDQMRKTGSSDRREDRPNMYYPVKDPDGNEVYPIAPAGYEGRWRFGPATFKKALAAGLIIWKKSKRDGGEIWWPYVKYYAENRTKRPSPLWTDLDGNKKAARDLRDLFGGKKLFDFPKPVQLLQRCIQIVPNMSPSEDIILDFFSGSATAAHAVMQLNAEDGGKRRHIMVQLPEPCDDKSEAFKAGYATIAEIGKERIRRAGKRILDEWQAKQAKEMASLGDLLHPSSPPDIGFRVLKIDSSNMEDVYYSPDSVKQDDLLSQADNLKQGRTPEDLLFQVLLDLGLDLALPITQETIEGKTVFFVDENALAACFEPQLSEEFVKQLARRRTAQDLPLLRAVFRDSSYGSDSVKINVEQIFKLLSPSTELKTL